MEESGGGEGGEVGGGSSTAAAKFRLGRGAGGGDDVALPPAAAAMVAVVAAESGSTVVTKSSAASAAPVSATPPPVSPLQLALLNRLSPLPTPPAVRTTPSLSNRVTGHGEAAAAAAAAAGTATLPDASDELDEWLVLGRELPSRISSNRDRRARSCGRSPRFIQWTGGREICGYKKN